MLRGYTRRWPVHKDIDPTGWCPSISGTKTSDSELVRINTALPPWHSVASGTISMCPNTQESSVTSASRLTDLVSLSRSESTNILDHSMTISITVYIKLQKQTKHYQNTPPQVHACREQMFMRSNTYAV